MPLLRPQSSFKARPGCALADYPRVVPPGIGCLTRRREFCYQKMLVVARRDRRCSRRLKAGLEWAGSTTQPQPDTKQMKFSHKVCLDVPAALEVVWQLWSDIRCAPLWMRWIDAVEILCQDGTTVDESATLPGLNSLSRWKCSTPGFEVWWVARIQKFEVSKLHRVLQWVTVDGLPNAGEVVFIERSGNNTRVELSISHSLPAALARVMTSSALLSLVKATLQSDLERFQQYVCKTSSQLR